MATKRESPENDDTITLGVIHTTAKNKKKKASIMFATLVTPPGVPHLSPSSDSIMLASARASLERRRETSEARSK